MPVSSGLASAATIFQPTGLLHTLLNLSLSAVAVLAPCYGADGTVIEDFAWRYLNPAGQHLLGQPERPASTLHALFAGLRGSESFAGYCRAFATGEPTQQELPYPTADGGAEGYLLTAAQRHDDVLLVSFTPLHEQSHVVAAALRASQAREQAARAEAEAALAEAERQRELLRRVLEQAPALIAVLHGPEHHFTFFNDLYQQTVAGRGELGGAVAELFPELREQGYLALLDQVLASGQPFGAREQVMQLWPTPEAAPTTLWLDYQYQPLRDATGQTNGILIFGLDVTAKVLARQQLEQLNQDLEARVLARTAEADAQRARLASAFEHAPAAIAVYDGPEFVVELANAEYQALLPGRPLLGKPVREAFPEVAELPLYQTLRQVYATGQLHEERDQLIPLPGPDGQLENRYFNFTLQARYDAQARIDGVIGFGFEVTEQVLARQQVEAAARRLRLLTDALPVLVGYLDREQRYQFTNRAYEAWFNQPADALLGRAVRAVVGEAAYQNAAGYIDRTLAGERLSFTTRMPYRDGFAKYIHTDYIPDVQQGEVVGFYTLVIDQTEQVTAREQVQALNEELAIINEELKATNEELHDSNTRLMHSNADLDTFVYTASHDLKSPIANVEGLLLALRELLPPEVQQDQQVAEVLALLDDTVTRFRRTITQLTDLVRLQQSQRGPAEPVEVRPLLDAVCHDLAPEIRAAGATVHVEVPAGLLIRFAPANLRSIVYNLLSNAVKYRAFDRAAQVWAQVEPLPSGQVVLTVRDNGLGLTLSQQQRLFQVFQRLHTHVEGTGVGLYMIKRLIENAGATISVSSLPGVGSTFTVTFPL